MCYSLVIIAFIILNLTVKQSIGFLEPAKWSFSVNQKSCHFIQVHRALFKDSAISIRIACDPTIKQKDLDVRIGWVLRHSPCFDEYMAPELSMPQFLGVFYDCPFKTIGDFGYTDVLFLKRQETRQKCNHLIDASLISQVDRDFERHVFTANQTRCIEPERMVCDASPPPPALYAMADQMVSLNRPIVRLDKRSATADEGAPHVQKLAKATAYNSQDHQIVVPRDGVYLLIVKVTGEEDKFFDLDVDIEMKGPNGYLSAADEPLLLFYAIMCVIYLLFATYWMVVSAMRWRDLLRIQFWIGGVIFLGMVEKAVFYAEYSAVNSAGISLKSAMLFAEIVSCLKRTLARMLVIIVSLGYGIVRPRLGSMFHRVVGIGALYLLLSSVESVLRVYKPKNDLTNQTLVAEVPLAFLDSMICWWVFNSLVQTTRTLRIRSNAVKLKLYNEFTNCLIYSVIASIIFMMWIISHKLTACLTDWNKLWMDEGFWHVLFSVILMRIMVLWRPTNNNQRYAFTPLLDASDDDDEPFLLAIAETSDGMKLRQSISLDEDQLFDSETLKSKDVLLSRETEADLKWVQENVSSFVTEAGTSLMDSDEEIQALVFERNKME